MPSDRLAGWDSHPLEIADFHGVLSWWEQRQLQNLLLVSECNEITDAVANGAAANGVLSLRLSSYAGGSCCNASLCRREVLGKST